MTSAPPLTSLAKAGGCAAKYPAARLEKLLSGIVPPDAADLLIGLDPADDAAVYRLDDDRALVFTVDFFPPVVDDPRTFGAIAATNALNDVFAMGGAPLLALSIAAFPEELPTELLGEILEGAREAVRRPARSSPAGTRSGTTSRNTASPSSAPSTPTGIWPKSGARPGDALFLTKRARHGARPAGPARGSGARRERSTRPWRRCSPPTAPRRTRCGRSARTPSPT